MPEKVLSPFLNVTEEDDNDELDFPPPKQKKNSAVLFEYLEQKSQSDFRVQNQRLQMDKEKHYQDKEARTFQQRMEEDLFEEENREKHENEKRLAAKLALKEQQ